MAVPVAASMRIGEDSKFDQMLRESAANEQPEFEAPVRPRDSETATEEELTHENSDAPAPQQLDRSEIAEAAVDVSKDGESEATVDLEADATESMQRGEPEQQTTSAGKGTDSPRTSPMTSETLIAANLHAQPVAQQQLTGNPQAQAQAAATGKTIEPTIRGSLNGGFATSTSTKVADVQGAYSAKSQAQAQMLEQARDSVFKQILMKLNSEGGEVRMRLEPPDLGQLDLRMTVEGGNKLSLQISADRQDINQLLQRHLDELKQTLQASGLEITGAEVQTRSEFDSQQAQRDASNGEVAANDIPDSTESAPRTRGYITAEGLDFWA